MPLALAAVAALAGAIAATAANAQEPQAQGVLGTGLRVGTALLILLAVLIGASVLSKLLIVFGVVPRRPETAVHGIVHAMANFVGGLARTRPRRRDGHRADDR